MQTLTIGRSTYKLSPSRNVGELQSKLSKLTGKTKKTIIAKERRSYPVFKAGQSTSEYVNAFYAINDMGPLMLFDTDTLNTEPCTLYSGEDVHETLTDDDCAPETVDISPSARIECLMLEIEHAHGDKGLQAALDTYRRMYPAEWNRACSSIAQEAAPVDLALVVDVPAPIELAAPVAAVFPSTVGEVFQNMRERTPLQYLPIFVRLAIEWIDSNSEMRNTQALDDMIDAYAKTYGASCDDADRKSAHYLCARRFWNFLVISADPAPVEIAAPVAADPSLVRSAWNDATPAPKARQARRNPCRYGLFDSRGAMVTWSSTIRGRNKLRQQAEDYVDRPDAPYSVHKVMRAECDAWDDSRAPVAAPLPRVLYSDFIRSAGKREAPMMA